MKTSFLVIGGLSVLAATGAKVSGAPVVRVVASARKSKPKATKAAKAPDYEKLRRSLKVDPLLSAASVRRDVASHAGRVIEVRGTVSGTMSVAGVQSVVLRSDDASTVTFSLPTPVATDHSASSAASTSTTPIFPGSELLRPGARVRVLLLVVALGDASTGDASTGDASTGDASTGDASTGDASTGDASTGDASTTQDGAASLAASPVEASFTPLAVAKAPKLAPAIRDGTVVISAEGEQSPIFGTNVPNPVPPMTGRPRAARIAEPPPAQPPSIAAARPGIDPDAGDSLEDQKPAYKNLVRRFNRKLSDAQVDEIATALLQAGYQNGMDPRFLAAIIAVESDFDIYCLSGSGAMGLGQIMPFNLKEARITNAWNPTQNVMGTARLLRGHLNDYRNRSDGVLLAVAAYNAGPGAVRRAGYRVPPGKQVQRYVVKVYNRYREFAPDMFK